MYLKLISAVTEDILSRGHISDRFGFCFFSPLASIKTSDFAFFFSRILTLVMQRHIDMNRHHLEEVSL